MTPEQVQNQFPKLMNLFQCGHLEEARALGGRMLGVLPLQPQLLALMGAIHGRLGAYREAESCYRTLVSLESGVHMHHCYLGLALVMQQRLPEAVPVFQRMLQLRPDFAEGHMQMGCLLRDLGRAEEACRHFERALELAPALADAAVFLGNLRVLQGRLEDALACYEQALKHRPGFPDAVAGKALVLERRGDKAAAWALLQPLVDQGVVTPSIAIMYALLAPKYAAADRAIALLESLLARGGLAPSQQQEMHFALGRLCDRTGDYDKAFTHYAAGNRLSVLAFDVPALRDKAQRIMRVFSGVDGPEVTAVPEHGPAPLFIVGMPRSGTSLVEQILASHSDVAAGGELEVLPDVERMAPGLLGSAVPYPECLAGATPEQLSLLVDRYRDAIAGIAGGARYVTDKLPPNYERLGLIQRLFPDARIIHVRRDARDTCLSCFFQNFGNTHIYSTDLRALGEVYGIYRDLMAHWQATLRMPILDIDYEAIVAEPEASVRHLLAFCGLPWQDECLNFHATSRYVHTASYDQVRQPLYDSSVGRWRNYEIYLQALIMALPEEFM